MSTAAMAAQTPFKPPFQQTPYAGGAQYTQPQLPSGTTTPGNVSPTSPRTSSGIHLHHARQLRPPQKPLYVPAVLRPTEKPAKHSPPKASETDGERPEALFRSAVRRATSDSVESGIATIGSDESSEGCGPVTGPPSRNHWKLDSSTQVCTASCCQKPFSFFDRRHHCRRCGGIFCGAHSANLVRLNQHALFHPDGAQYRACDRCHTDYRGWEARRHSRSNSESSSVSGALTIDSPTAARRPDGGLRVGSVAGSAPATWAWSTF